MKQEQTNQSKRRFTGRTLLFVFLIGVLAMVVAACGSDSGDAPSEIRMDYAYYNPTSLIIREFGWMEEEFADEDINITWELSHGSNVALQYLTSNSVDFGSTAGSAALVAKAQESPIKNVYIFSQPEWTALVTTGDSDITEVADLAGKSIAATAGTDPYIFLLRALNEAGLSSTDVTINNIQHGDGANVLVQGGVDAWAGLDPHMARLELEQDAVLFYRNTGFNTYGFLNVREAFAENYPEYVERVLQVYERARAWALENPEGTAEILANEAGINLDVALLQIGERNTFDNPIPGAEHFDSVGAAGEVLQSENLIDASVDIQELLQSLIDSSYAENVVNQ